MDSADGALALVLLLDQIPRNVFRGSAARVRDRFVGAATTRRARWSVATTARSIPALRVFFYMPFEHSEHLADQERGVALTAAIPGDDSRTYLDYAQRHCDVIRRFGRFPHRNRVLGRESTAEEQAYLDAGGGFT